MGRSAILTDCYNTLIGRTRTHAAGDPEVSELNWRTIVEMRDAYLALAEHERIIVKHGMTSNESMILLSIAKSAAQRAVQRISATEPQPGTSWENLVVGLFALIVENSTDDYRETTIRLALLDDAAKKNGLRLEDVYEQVKQYAETSVAELIEGFFAKGERTIASMGYIESTDRFGNFRYERNW